VGKVVGLVAQRSEQSSHKAAVTGSNPVQPILKKEKKHRVITPTWNNYIPGIRMIEPSFLKLEKFVKLEF
jgi:hypothetical protein